MAVKVTLTSGIFQIQKEDKEKGIAPAIVGPNGNKVYFRPWGEQSRHFDVKTSTDARINTGRSTFNLVHGPSRGDDCRYIFRMLTGREAEIVDAPALNDIINAATRLLPDAA